MNSAGKDIQQIENFQKSLDEYVEGTSHMITTKQLKNFSEKEKLKNQLSSAKAEKSQLMDKIKSGKQEIVIIFIQLSAKEELKKIIEENEKIRS
ncbi:unnamed protein product [Trichobilharzia szidati]|nr:unnamed protein product [Trichobilharzia szidati]